MQTAVRYPNNFLPGNNSAPRRGSQALGWNQAMSVMSACQYVSLVSEWPMPPNQTSKAASGHRTSAWVASTRLEPGDVSVSVLSVMSAVRPTTAVKRIMLSQR